MVKSAENLKVDPISGGEYRQHGHKGSSMKHTSMQPQSVSTLSSDHLDTYSMQLQSTSHVSRSGDPQQLQVRKSPVHVKPLPDIMDPAHSLKVRSWRKCLLVIWGCYGWTKCGCVVTRRCLPGPIFWKPLSQAPLSPFHTHRNRLICNNSSQSGNETYILFQKKE